MSVLIGSGSRVLYFFQVLHLHCPVGVASGRNKGHAERYSTAQTLAAFHEPTRRYVACS
jgi:hypothetical protein